MRYFLRMCLALIGLAFFEFAVLYVFVPHAYAADWRPGYVQNTGCAAGVAASDNGPMASDGNAQCETLEGIWGATYTYNVSGLTFYSTPTDVLCIPGSATKVVRLITMNMDVHSSAVLLMGWYLIMRSAADTGGSPVSLPATQSDSADPSPSAVPVRYTAAPSALGTSAGSLANYFRLSPAQLATVNPTAIPLLSYVAGSNVTTFQKNVTLRGTAQNLCLNYNGAALPAGFSADVTFTLVESAQ